MRSIFSLKLLLPGLLFCGLLGLGFWQLVRYEESSQIHKELQENKSLPRVNFESLTTYTNFQPVHAKGTYLHYFQVDLVAKSYQGRVGVVVLAPFKLTNGKIITVNRGWTLAPKSIENPHGQVEIKGVIREYPANAGWLTPPNSRAEWHTINYADLKSYGGHDLLPVYIAIDAPQHGLQPHMLSALGKSDPQRHLNYALTWFALALALVIMTFSFLRKS